MSNKRVTIVLPTIREANLIRFQEEWKDEFANPPGVDLKLLVVEDNPEKTFDVRGDDVAHLCWQDIEKDLGENSWIIPRRSDTVRSYGYWKAYQDKPDIIITLDDDCYPYPKGHKEGLGFIASHVDQMGAGRFPMHRWTSTATTFKPRGVPFYELETEMDADVVINHGMWYNVPDYDAPTSLAQERIVGHFDYADEKLIPPGLYFPMCGMNLAWRAEATPAMYFLLMGQNAHGKYWDFDRFGDIWCGLLVKKVVDHLGLHVATGRPIIYHDRASNVFQNLVKEAKGIGVNEHLWQRIDAVRLTASDFKGCYIQIAEQLDMQGEYWDRLKKAMRIWAELF